MPHSNRLVSALGLVCFWLAVGLLQAQSVYFFQDSNNSGYYDTGLAFRTPPSAIEQTGPSGDKIPVEYDIAPYEGENALRLRWTSQAGGDWSALVIAPGFPFQNISQSDTLSFWCYAPDGLDAEDLPLIFMEGAPGNVKSLKYEIAPYVGDIAAQSWTRVAIPLDLFFDDPNQTNISFTQIKAIIFGQNEADGEEHTLLIDQVRTYSTGSGAVLETPTGLTATGYDSHAELRWEENTEPNLGGYKIYRSLDGGNTFSAIRFLSGQQNSYIDFTRPLGNNLSLAYRISAVSSSELESDLSPSVETATFDMTDEELLTMVQEYTFRYFWDFAHPVSGLARERNTSNETVTMGGSGFGFMAILVGIERGFITYQQGLDRILMMVNFLENADRFHGAYPHWMNGTTGNVVPFSAQDNGGDIVETAFLFEGLLTVREYFSGEGVLETTLRDKITQLWEAIEWNWYRQQNQDVMTWHWSPNFGYAINLPVRGWNETMMVYLLGIASPTEGIPASLYDTGWAGGNYTNGFSYYGYELPLGDLLGGPLFFTHYSFIGFDPRYLADDYTNYFVQNRNQTLINRAYCINNPGGYEGYGENCWGLTASDNPFGYLAHEPSSSRDNGTITPTAALSSMPYTYAESMEALKHFYRDHGQRLWGPMGFYDAFNLTEDWFASSYLAIDQGPIITMIENYRTQLLWDNFMANPEIQQALDVIGFAPDSSITATTEIMATPEWVAELRPNIAHEQSTLHLSLTHANQVSITLWNQQGQQQGTLLQNEPLAPGQHQFTMNTTDLKPGLYYLYIQTITSKQTLKLIII